MKPKCGFPLLISKKRLSLVSEESNGIKDDKYELEWAADEGNFFDVVQMINSGYQLVEKVVSR